MSIYKQMSSMFLQTCVIISSEAFASRNATIFFFTTIHKEQPEMGLQNVSISSVHHTGTIMQECQS